MMAVLVRDDVALRKRAAPRAEARAQLVEEREVEVHLAVTRTVEGAFGRARDPAARIDCAGVDDGVRRKIGVPAPVELRAPVLLDAVDKADDAAVGAPVRVRSRAALLHGRHALDRTRRDVSGEWIDAEEERGDEDEQADPAAPDQDRTAHAASPPCVLDLRRIEARAVVESHARSPCTSGARGRLGLAPASLPGVATAAPRPSDGRASRTARASAAAWQKGRGPRRTPRAPRGGRRRRARTATRRARGGHPRSARRASGGKRPSARRDRRPRSP